MPTFLIKTIGQDRFEKKYPSKSCFLGASSILGPASRPIVHQVRDGAGALVALTTEARRCAGGVRFLR